MVYEATDIVMSYGHVVIHDGGSTGVDADEVVDLVGGNGAGKSTLVKVLSGAIAREPGQVEIEGAPSRWASPHDGLEPGTGTRCQDSGLALDLSIAANSFLGRERRVTGPGRLFNVLTEREVISDAREGFAMLGEPLVPTITGLDA